MELNQPEKHVLMSLGMAIFLIIVAFIIGGLSTYYFLNKYNKVYEDSLIDIIPTALIVQTEKWFNIPELGIRFKNKNGILDDLIYAKVGIGTSTVGFSTNELASLSERCNPSKDAPLGQLWRADKKEWDSCVAKGECSAIALNAPSQSDITIPFKLGDYYFEYSRPQSACAEDASKLKNVTRLNASSFIPTIELDILKSYVLKSNIGTLSLQYPPSFTIEGSTGINGDDLDIVIIKNFDWKKDGFGLGFIKPLSSEKFYMIGRALENSKKLNLNDWLKENTIPSYNSLERVQAVDEYKSMYGTVIKEIPEIIGDNPAIERIISYPTLKGDLPITYTYVQSGFFVFQFVNENNTDLEMYHQILSTFKFTQ